jgi:murein DD-endopeptidase MepM/ murein hydrolase activator NlpD
MAEWRRALLKTLNMPDTQENLVFLGGWQRWEGGHTNNDASFNWLNTTKDAPGAVGSINSVGVKKFATFKDGIQATAQTLYNGRYEDILNALASGDPFRASPTAGLQTWVSGRPDGNPEYARKVLGGSAQASGRSPSPAAPSPAPRPGTRQTAKQKRADDDWNWTMDFVFGGKDPEFAAAMKKLPSNHKAGEPGPVAPSAPKLSANGKTLRLGTSWSGTHVTSNLDWNRGKKTAVDIMAAPGTAVTAPEPGQVVRHGSAQGGQALYFMGDSGRLYWMGHVENMAPPGTRVKAGGRLALISADHANPHLHLDKYEGDSPGRFA